MHTHFVVVVLNDITSRQQNTETARTEPHTQKSKSCMLWHQKWFRQVHVHGRLDCRRKRAGHKQNAQHPCRQKVFTQIIGLKL